MTKVIIFSRQFPSYHPRSGEPTYFIEKLWASIGRPKEETVNQFIWPSEWLDQSFSPKHHTIRAGHRFKEGEYFSPRVWSGKPYNSKQIIIAPDTEIEKVWNFRTCTTGGAIQLGNDPAHDIEKVASNDGLLLVDFFAWFKFPSDFDGQIICWNGTVKY